MNLFRGDYVQAKNWTGNNCALRTGAGDLLSLASDSLMWRKESWILKLFK